MVLCCALWQAQHKSVVVCIGDPPQPLPYQHTCLVSAAVDVFRQHVITWCIRDAVWPAVADQQELWGQLVCFKYCGILKRDFAVLLSAQQHQHDQQQADVLDKQHQQEHGDGRHSLDSSRYKVCVWGGCPEPWQAHPAHAGPLAADIRSGMVLSCMS